MMTRDRNMAVGFLVAEQPARARVLERFGLDYCCGGHVPLARACAVKGIDVELVLRGLEACDAEARSAATEEWLPRSMTELIDFIVATHHAYLRQELPRLSALASRVAEAHEATHPELREVRRELLALAVGLLAHLEEEETVLFPRIKQLQAGRVRDRASPGAVAAVIGDLERDHRDAGATLARIRALTGDLAPPADACAAYRALLAGLGELQRDLHAHVHRENSILFPAAIAAERASSGPPGPPRP